MTAILIIYTFDFNKYHKNLIVKKYKAMAKNESTNEISVSGNKKIKTLQKEFNKKFPFIRIALYPDSAKKIVAKGGTITQLDGEQTLASVRRENTSGSISISGNKKVSTLEQEFDKVFGLYCQVCYTSSDDHRYYTGSSEDQKTLHSLNESKEAAGCKKNEWR